MTVTFRKATKAQSRARIALIGRAGSGKTYTALALATALGQKVAVIDTERGSASKYADLFAFDVLELDEYDPRTYVAAIQAAQQAGYDVLVIDSLSHAWTGKGGVLDIKDAATRRSRTGDSFGAGWREASPLHNQLVDAMLQSRVHLIATMRAKTEYLVSRNAKGETKIEKIGLAPVQRDGLEYEFDIVGDLDGENNLAVTKTRCPALVGQVVNRPDAKLAHVIADWLTDGVVVDSDRLGGEPPPAQLVGSNVPTLEQIQALRDPGAARALWERSDDFYKAAIVHAVTGSPAVGVTSAAWRQFYQRAPIEAWKDRLHDALVELHAQQQHEMSTAGASSPPAGPAVDPDGSGPPRAGRPREAGNDPATIGVPDPNLLDEDGD